MDDVHSPLPRIRRLLPSRKQQRPGTAAPLRILVEAVA
jgi:hypothetical protein